MGSPSVSPCFWDATFLLSIGSFLLTIELLCLQWCLGAFFLTIGPFFVAIVN